MFTEIRYEVDGPAAIVTLDRPDHLNAFTGTMLGELLEAFDRRMDQTLAHGQEGFASA